MNKYSLIWILVFIFSVIENTGAQNFFPLSIGNKYEFVDHYLYPCTPMEWTKYLASEIQDSLIYNGEIFYKYVDYNKEYYFKYDSYGQKLYTYDDFFHKKLAADFNLSGGEQFTSYINGTGLIYTSLGDSVVNIFGENRDVWTMRYQNPTNNNIELYTFVDGIGFYKYYLSGHCGPMQYTFYDDLHYLSAIIGPWEFNPLDIYLNLLTTLNDRNINDFPFYINISVDMPVPVLLDSLYIYYRVVRNGGIIFDHQASFNRTTYQAIVNLNSTILEAGDTVNLKIVGTDSSIFYNYATLPETGFYSIKVLGDTTSSTINIGKNVFHFSLGQNYPNPFNPITSIQYSLGSPQYVTLKVYDILGKDRAALVNEEQPAGSYSVKFDGSNFSNGIYFYQLKAGSYTATKKLIILK